MAEDFDLETLVHVEETFYETGYQDGYAHGRIHGLIEGRALGREKGFEMWEELGFYEGFALFWKSVCMAQPREDDRVFNHITRLLTLIGQFPRSNPSMTDQNAIDIPKLFRQIRSRYKVLCATLGVRPSLRASEDEEKSTTKKNQEMGDQTELSVDVQGSKKSIWAVENVSMDY